MLFRLKTASLNETHDTHIARETVSQPHRARGVPSLIATCWPLRPRGSGASAHYHTAVTVSSCPADLIVAAGDQTFHFTAGALPCPLPAPRRDLMLPSSHSEARGFLWLWTSELSICLQLPTLFLLNQADIIAPQTPARSLLFPP